MIVPSHGGATKWQAEIKHNFPRDITLIYEMACKSIPIFIALKSVLDIYVWLYYTMIIDVCKYVICQN